MFEHHTDAVKWNKRYQSSEANPEAPPQPCSLLASQSNLLPNSGIALDLACGLGGNAIFLANKGWNVEAVDISEVALGKLSDIAENLHLSINTQLADIEKHDIPNNHFDCIVVSYFLERELCDALQAALKPGGLLFYQTFSKDKVSNSGPSSDRFLLNNNELLSLFPELIVRYYQDFGHCGAQDIGDHNTAQLVAQKRR